MRQTGSKQVSITDKSIFSIKMFNSILFIYVSQIRTSVRTLRRHFETQHHAIQQLRLIVRLVIKIAKSMEGGGTMHVCRFGAKNVVLLPAFTITLNETPKLLILHNLPRLSR